MNCPRCKKHKLQVTHVYDAGDSAETRNLRCLGCDYRASSITFLVVREQRVAPGRGGWALSKKIRSGVIANPVKPRDTDRS